jgi:heavy metal sensor kinase
VSWWTAHSVRRKLTLWYVGAMIVVLAVYAAAVYSFVSRSLSQSLDQQLRRDFQWAAATVYQTREGIFTWTDPQEIVAEEELPWVQVWSDQGNLLFANSEAERRRIPETRALALAADTTSDAPAVVDTPGAATRILSRRGSIGPQPVIIQVARSEAAMRQSLGELLLVLVLGLPIAVTLAGLGGYTLARRALAPVERMTERARSITAERLSDRLPVTHPDDEMGRLATVFNETLARLESSFEHMRQFTADVSHELRTPLTAIRSVGEVGLREHRGDAEYRAIIGSMLEEVDRLASLVDRLLTLSRAEMGVTTIARDDIDLQKLADEVVSHLSVLAEEKKQSISVESAGSPHAIGDRLAIRQAVINLVDNAIKFSPAGGRIRLRVAETPRDVVLDVIDTGPGIDGDARSRIFDRFYRGVAVTGATPGTGLGLSIAKGAVEANAGRLTLESSAAGGSIFRVTLPSARRKRTLKAS